MMDFHPLSVPFRLGLLSAMFVICFLMESKWPLRKVTRPKLPRVFQNLKLAAVGALTLRFIFFPMVLLLSNWTMDKNMGVLNQLELPPIAHLILALLLLDYTLYIWHRLNHKAPLLWRFHNVHHVDLDLDVSTASRFHFGELAISTGYRSLQVIFFGIDLMTIVIFETAITLSAQFHHSNIKLPKKLEHFLRLLTVTPRMHGIHHSIVKEETDSNFAVIFSFWDRLHRSLKLNITQDQIIIGVPAYRSPGELNFVGSLLLPFKRTRAWKLPDGTIPQRKENEK